MLSRRDGCLIEAEREKDMQKDVITVTQAAEAAGFNRSYIKFEIAYGRLPATKNATGGYEISRPDFEAWLDSPKRGSRGGTIFRQLVDAYRGFYRADDFKNSNSIVRPINVVAQAIADAVPLKCFQGETKEETAEALYEVAYGALYHFMSRVAKGAAEGRFPAKSVDVERDEAMMRFTTLFLDKVFLSANAFNGDIAMLRSPQMENLKNACAKLYRELQYSEWRKSPAGGEETN